MFRHTKKICLRGLETEILKHVYSIKVKGQICEFVIVFFVILGLENVYLDTKIFFPSDLDTEILIHVCSGSHFEKWPPLRSRVKFGMAL